MLPAQVIFATRPALGKKLRKPDKDHERMKLLPIRPFITAYRGGMMIITCLAILAVDFRIFPRRFAKVETWGTSLMDMGVGSFVFAAGLVSARPIIIQSRHIGEIISLGKLLRDSLRSSVPLLALGLIRLYSVKGLEYAEHVTEYGVHWNFFFTLGFLPPFVALCQPLSAMISSPALLSLLISGIYQASLDFTSLKSYILTAPRTDILSQNREGIFSFWGYLAIFMAGQAIGFETLDRSPFGTFALFSPLEKRKRLIFRMTIWSILWSVTYLLASTLSYGLNIRISRRLANFPYVLWVSAFNTTQITAYCLIETCLFPGVYRALDAASERRECDKATSRIVNAFNRNGLVIFLVANLLTGVVNLTLDTLSMGPWGSMVVLGGYASLLTAFAVGLDIWDLSIKL